MERNIVEFFRTKSARDTSSLVLYFAGREKCLPGHHFGPAIRAQYLLHFIIGGKGEFHVNGNVYHLAKNQVFLDDRENPQGIAVPYFEKYIEVVKSIGDAEVQKEKANLIEIYNSLAYQFVQKEDFAKAKQLAEETIKLDAENTYAKQILDFVVAKQAELQRTGR